MFWSITRYADSHFLANIYNSKTYSKSIFLRKTVIHTIRGENEEELPSLWPTDSVIVYQQFPFRMRSDTFYGDKVDCICQDSNRVYINNHLTKYKTIRLGEYRGNQIEERLEVSFFDPIIGWQGISDQIPIVGKDTLYENIECFKVTQTSWYNRHHEHLIQKSNYRLLFSLSKNENGSLISQTFYKNHQVVQGITYPFTEIHDMYFGNQIGRTAHEVSYVLFNAPQPSVGLYDCMLKSVEIK